MSANSKPRRDDPFGEIADAMLATTDKISSLLEDIKDMSSAIAAKQIVAHLPGAIDRLVKVRWRKLWIEVATIIVMVGISSGILGYWLGETRTRLDGLVCKTKDGGVVCQGWLVKPTE